MFSLSTIKWTKTATTGTPPAGVIDYGTAFIGQDMFVFGGRCDYYGKCCHNTLYALNTLEEDTFWRNIPCTDGPIEKNSCGFISYSYQGIDYLLALGGRAGKRPTQQQQHSLYIPHYCYYFTNEIHTMEMTSSQGNICMYNYYSVGIGASAASPYLVISTSTLSVYMYVCMSWTGFLSHAYKINFYV